MLNLLLEGVAPLQIKTSDIIFYVLLGVLLLATIIICAIFTKSKKFKMKKQEKEETIKKLDAYKAPNIIEVKNDNSVTTNTKDSVIENN